jgi:hypothetical protein
MQSYTGSELSRENISSVPRPIAPGTPALHPSRPPKYGAHQLATRQSLQHPSTQSQQQLPSSSTQQPIATSSNSIINPTNTGKEYTCKYLISLLKLKV